MKIGILTFHYEDNYGAVLQSFALQKFLQNQGYSVELIDFNRRKSVFRINNWLGKSLGATFFKTKKQLIKIFGSRERANNFTEFRKSYLTLGKDSFSTFKSLCDRPPVVDVLIVGSDQVWSPKLVSRKDYPAYWLDFGSNQIKRMSYAASFGGEYCEDACYARITKWASNFTAISVREKLGVEFLLRKNVKDVTWAPDPTFLLDWKSLSKPKRLVQRKCIAQFVLKRQNLDLADEILAGHKKYREFENERHFDLNAENLSPLDWVERMSSLKFVITDSFHGTVFCLLTNTPFVTILWQGSGEFRNDRIISLLEDFGLESRTIKQRRSTYESFFGDDINWRAVNLKIDKMRELGSAFLLGALRRT